MSSGSEPETPTSGAFDVRVQALLCPACGAPLTAPVEGVLTRCEHCGNALQVDPRPAASPPEPTREPGAISPYDTRENLPADLSGLLGRSYRLSEVQETLLPQLRERWKEALSARRRSREDPAAAHRLYLLSDRLAEYLDFYGGAATDETARRAPREQRSVMETALGLLEGTPYGYILRCDLSRAASRARDPASAEGWLAGLDPRPPDAYQETEHRLARSTLCVVRDDPRGILEVLGAEPSAVTLVGKRNQRLAAIQRVHAHERLGDLDRARQVFAEAYQTLGVSEMLTELHSQGLAPQLRASLMRRGRILRIVLLALGVGLAVGLVYCLVS